MNIRYGNPYAAIQVLVLVAMIFIGFWLFVPIFGNMYNRFTDDSNLEIYNTQESCLRVSKYWENGVCSYTSTRAKEVMAFTRRSWLAVPFIFVFSLIAWLWVRSVNRDSQQYGGGLQ